MGILSNKINSDQEMEIEIKDKDSSAASFEEAIVATQFGKYNCLLLAIISLPCISQLLNTVEISYVLPVAECDLSLTLEDKGILNAITFAGMVSTGIYWGYLCDVLGRKKIIVYGYLLSGVFALIAALSANKFVMMAAKFMSGAIVNGPFAATICHIAEFHAFKYRGRVNMARGIFFSAGGLILPILSWAILPRNWNISVFGMFGLRSWNIFLLVCACSAIFSGMLYILLPESPKYLMSTGRNTEALLVMQNIYSMNTGNAKRDFPIKALTEEVENNARNVNLITSLKIGLSEIKHLLRKPFITHLLLACFNVFCLLIGVNTLKLWLPGIFQAISDYENMHNASSNNLCTMLEQMTPQDIQTSENCNVDLDNLSVYVNTFIVAVARIAAFLLSGLFIRMLGVKKLNITTCFLTSALTFSIYFASNSTTVTILSATGTALGSVAENLLVSLTLELFPTNLRTLALSIHLTSGRAGTLIGNIVFPYLLSSGCLPPFLLIGAFSSACGLLSMLYPNIEDKPLK